MKLFRQLRAFVRKDALDREISEKMRAHPAQSHIARRGSFS